jgi:glucose-6-phosphate isomerase
LDQHARSSNWLKVFEMADSICGRTSETSIVGDVPAAWIGIDFKKFLAGACAMDSWTRDTEKSANPAMMLSAMWYIAGKGRGDRNMVIVPYSDRLVLLSRYLQQLVMESLGKALDLDGKEVNQGLNVFGNKGGTDAHAFIQQLNDGRDDFFATFIEVLADARKIDMGDGFAMGDYLHGFLEGLSAALRGKGRQTIQIKLPRLDEFTLGQIIALYERSVAIYAEFININAFHQPGVQAYKLAANGILELAAELNGMLEKIAPVTGSAAEIAAKVGKAEKSVEIAGLLDKAALNSDKVSRTYDATSSAWIYSVK